MTARYVTIWHEPKRSEGGIGRDLAAYLRGKGVDAKSGPSCYHGHIAIRVKDTQTKKADIVLEARRKI